MTYFQWAHGGKIVSTPNCEPGKCSHFPDTSVKPFWAWDRRLGAWVHYPPIAWGQEAMYTIQYVPRLDRHVIQHFARYYPEARRYTTRLDDLRHHARDV